MKEDPFELLMQGRKKEMVKAAVECNEYTSRFGVVLSQEEALVLYEARNEVLKREERVEFGGGILTKIIYEFCDSPFIYQDNYAETLEELQRIFYMYKNEAMDEVTDDELLYYMKTCFNGRCGGSLEHLEDTCLEELARAMRGGSPFE